MRGGDPRMTTRPAQDIAAQDIVAQHITAGPWLMAGGRPIAPSLAAADHWLFALPDKVPPLRLRAAPFCPAEHGASGDRRRLGVALTRLGVLRCGGVTEIPLAALDEGCHAPEDGWRWTSGDTPLPAAVFAGSGGKALLVQGFLGPGAMAGGTPALFLPGDSHPRDAHVAENLFAALRPTFAECRIDGAPPVPPVAERLAALLARPPASPAILFGRSSGLRVATLFAAARPDAVRAVIGFGYPFLPPGAAPEPERFAHLAKLATPTLILQGRDDAYGGEAVPRLIPLSPAVRLEFIAADHELHLDAAAWAAVARRVLLFVAGLSPGA